MGLLCYPVGVDCCAVACGAARARTAVASNWGSWRTIVPYDVYAGCDKVGDILDLFWHQMRLDKWAGLIKGLDFINQGVSLITSSAAGPTHSTKGLAIFTIHSTGHRASAGYSKCRRRCCKKPGARCTT